MEKILTIHGLSPCVLKMLKVMKLTTLFLLTTFIGAFASESYSQTTKLTLKAEQISLEDFLVKIEEQSEFRFFYTGKIDVEKKVSGNFRNQKIMEILNKISEEAEIKYEVMGRQIILSPANSERVIKSIQNQKTVSGKVTDSSGAPLPGVTIALKGTTNGTISNVDGTFVLNNIPENATLVFSFVGMKTQEITVEGTTSLNIVMEEDAIGLEEVVAIGYGYQKKSDVAGSVAIATSDDILKSSSFNALQGIKGKVAGVNIFSNSGNPTGNPRVIIRGINSINTTSDPLYVVDGVQMTNIQYINPNDIERIEVLKDASATAIYGARGANGVILVTTKRGSGEGEGVTISYEGWISLGTLARKIDLMNSEEFMKMEEIGFSNFSKYEQSQSYVGLKVDRSDPLIFDSQGNPLYDTDWQEEATRNAVSHNHQVNIQQQGKISSTGVFLNYTDQEGIMLNSYMKRYNAKFTYDVNPKSWLSTGMNLMVNYTSANDVEEISGVQTARRTMLEIPPILPVKFPDGSWSNSQYEGSLLNLGLEAMANPVHELETRKMNRFRTKIFGNAYVTFHIIDGLDLKSQLGVDFNNSVSKDYSPNDLINLSSPNGKASISQSEGIYWQEETYLNYNKTFKDFRINSVIGLSWWESTSKSFGTGDVIGFNTNFFGYDNLEAGTTPSAPTSSYSKWSMNSYFLRGSFTYKDKYLATLTGRIDGSSRFGKNNHYAFFPSVGLGWIISKEDFLNDIEWLTNLKLRTSYGRTGNSEISAYSTLATIESGTVLINGSRATSAYVSGLANPDLEWEKTDQFDMGLNANLLNNRINLELDYYYKLTSDLLLERPLPYTTGYSSVIDNIGEVSNRGVDILLNTVNVKTNDFNWETTFSANYNKNRIEKLGENNEDILTRPGFLGGRVILRVGESLSSFYGYERYGTWGTDEAEEAAQVGAVPGEAKRSKDRHIIGKGLPDWTGSFINTFSYKNWDLTVDLQFVYGVDTWQLFFHPMEDRCGIANGLKTVLYNAWTESNQNTMVQQIRQQNYSGQNSMSDSHWVCDGSYIRGNLIQLGYTFDKSFLDKCGFKRARAYFSVNNAFLICSSDFYGYDPEGVSNSSQFGQNIFFNQYPKPKTYTLGVNIGF